MGRRSTSPGPVYLVRSELGGAGSRGSRFGRSKQRDDPAKRGRGMPAVGQYKLRSMIGPEKRVESRCTTPSSFGFGSCGSCANRSTWITEGWRLDPAHC